MKTKCFIASPIRCFMPSTLYAMVLIFALPISCLGVTGIERPYRFSDSLIYSDLFDDMPLSYFLAYQEGTTSTLDDKDKQQFQNRYKKWNALPPSEKKKLRKRMDQWRNLPPQDQQKYRKRLKQWQKLTPQERKQYQKRLNNWESLTPEEKERLRRKFRR